MPAGDTNLKAVQIVTQRVTVEPESRRSHAEPIGRDFADLVAAARAAEEAESKPTNKADEDSSGNYLISSLVEDDDTATPADFLVANAALSEASQPVAGVMRHPQDQARAASTPTAAPTDILVDTNGLFLPPDPNRPIETAAVTGSTEFGALSWPPPESTSALQAAIANAGGQQPKVLVSADNATSVDALEGVELGPGASRQAARLHAASTLAESANGQAASTAQSQSGQGQATTPAAQAASTQTAVAPQPLPVEPAPPPPPQSASATNAQSAAPISATQSTQTAAAPPQAPPAALANAPSATVQIYNRIIERFDGRAQQYQLRLDPPELGKVNVRIEIGSDNRVQAILSTHDSNALADLLRGQRALEQSLSNAGLNLAEDGIKFELSDQGANQSAKQDETPTPRRGATAANDQLAAAAGASEPAPPSWARTRINIVA